MLLTGDIEKYAEQMLVINAREQLNSEMLIAPHHGSQTSGLKTFIAAVHPRFVVYAAGFLNRYHFPHQTVMAAYDEIKAQQLTTSTDGTLLFTLDERGAQFKGGYRENQHYWW